MQQAAAAVTTEINSKDKTVGLEIRVKKQAEAVVNKKIEKSKHVEPEISKKVEKTQAIVPETSKKVVKIITQPELKKATKMPASEKSSPKKYDK